MYSVLEATFCSIIFFYQSAKNCKCFSHSQSLKFAFYSGLLKNILVIIFTIFIFTGSLMMFFGCRSESGDYFFKDEWEPLVTAGRMTLFTAFSRDTVS